MAMETSSLQVTTTSIVTEQPAVGQSRTVIIHGPKAEHDWSSGLCECHKDVKSCLLSIFCLSCFTCYIATRQNESCCIPMWVNGAAVAMRTKIRAQNDIFGSICDDCIKLTFCPCCAMAQMSRELDYIDTKI